MKLRTKLLFLTHSFPPMHTAACNRTWNVSKHLSRLDWDVTVVTPNPSITASIDDSRKVKDFNEAGIRRILTNYEWRILLKNDRKGPLGTFATRVCRKAASQLGIDKTVGWIKPVESACRHLTSKDVDVILATGPPYVAFRLAKRLSQRLGRPYVLDYRDAWTANPFLRRPRRAAVNLERRLLEDSAAVITVSRSSMLSLNESFDVGSKSHVVTNGYDPVEMDNVKPYDFQHFAIVYTGSLISPKRLITPVMAALRRLDKLTEKESRPWKFHYYGPDGTHVHQEAKRFGILDRVVVHGRVHRERALSATCGAGVSVVINSTADNCTMNDKGVIPGKVFDPLGLGTPILLISPEYSDVREVVEESTDSKSVSGSDIEGMAQFLLQTMQINCANSRRSNGRYSWPVLARRLDSVLKCVAGNTSASYTNTHEHSLSSVAGLH